MPQSGRPLGWLEREHLAVRLLDVAHARGRLREAQSVPGGRGVHERRVDLIAALEAYREALTDIGAPLPRKLKAEIDLQRGIGHRR